MKKTPTYHFTNLYRLLCCLLLSLPTAHYVTGQTIQAGGQSYLTIGDTSLLVSGLTSSNNMRVQFNGGNNPTPNWKLTVQPLAAYFAAQQSSQGDVAQFGPGPNWPIQYFSIKFNPGASQNSWNDGNSINKIGAVSTTIPLSSSEITLVEKSNYKIVANDYFAMSYDLILNGSRQLLSLHRDNYVLVMRYRLYSSSGALLSQMDYNHQIGLWPPWLHLPQSTTPAITNSIILQNGGSNVSLNYGNNLQAYATGVETVLNNSLKVSSADGKYQVTVQSLSDYFTKTGAASSIPVSKIRLTAAPYTPSVVSSYTSVTLSSSPRTLILNNTSGGVINNYNLTYSTKTNANQDAFLNAPAGTYETQITFVMTPL